MNEIHQDTPQLLNDSIDLPMTVQAIKGGDWEASSRLFDHLNKWVRKRVSAKVFEGDVDDVTQVSLLNIVNQIPNFNPSEKSSDFKKKFYGWVSAITKGTIAGYYHRQEHEPILIADLGNNDTDDFQSDATFGINQEDIRRTPFPKERTVDNYPSDDMPKISIETIDPILSKLLSSREAKLVKLRLKGSKYKQLIYDTGLTRSQISSALNQAREKIEDKYLYPSGFRKVTEFSQGDYSSLISAAVKKRLRAVLFLGRWYTMDQWISEYKFSRRKTVTSSKDLVIPDGKIIYHYRVSYQSPDNILTKSLPNGFREWFFTSARFASKDKIPFRRRRILFENQDITNIHEKIFTDLIFWMKLNNIELTPLYQEILKLRILGDVPRIIGDKMNYSEAQISELVTQIRTRIENDLFKPNGILPIHVLPNNRQIRDSARHGYIPAVYIFGRWYTSEDKIKLNVSRPRIPK